MFHVSDDGDHTNENNETKWQENSCSLSMFALLVVLGVEVVMAFYILREHSVLQGGNQSR